MKTIEEKQKNIFEEFKSGIAKDVDELNEDADKRWENHRQIEILKTYPTEKGIFLSFGIGDQETQFFDINFNQNDYEILKSSENKGSKDFHSFVDDIVQVRVRDYMEKLENINE